MKTCIYARRSTSHIGQGQTLGNQIETCKAHAFFKDLEIVDVKQDTGSGRDDLSRPKVKELVDDAIAGKYECVIMKGISRLYRSVGDGLNLINKLIRHNIRLITVEENFDSTADIDVNGKPDLSKITIYLTFAEEESRKLGQRVKYTQINKAKNGEWNLPTTPFGYEYDSDTKKLKIKLNDVGEPEEAKIVQLIYDLYEEGNGTRTIVNYLNGENPYGTKFLRNENDWGIQTISYILKNNSYIGTVSYNMSSKKQMPYKQQSYRNKTDDDFWIGANENSKDKWVVTENAHQPIIDKEQFERVQSLINAKGKNKGLSQNRSLLGGIGKCGLCNSGISIRKRPRTEERFYYCCNYIKNGKKKGDTSVGCNNHHIKEEALEEKVVKEIEVFFKDEETLESAFSKKNNFKKAKTNLKKEERNISKDLEECQEMLAKLYEDHSKKKIADVTYEMMMARYNDKIVKLTEQLNEVLSKEQKSKREDREFHEFKKLYERFSDLRSQTKEQQRILLMELVNSIICTPTKNGDMKVKILFKTFKEGAL